jgi:hypothetical protein
VKKKFYWFIFIVVVIWLLFIFFVTSVNKTPTSTTLMESPIVSSSEGRNLYKQEIKPTKKYDVFKPKVKKAKSQTQKIREPLIGNTDNEAVVI